MGTRFLNKVLIAAIVFNCLTLSAQKFHKNKIIDSLIINQIKTKKKGFKYDEVDYNLFTINKIKLFDKIEKSFGSSSKIISESFLDNSFDVDNPRKYKKRFVLINNSKFQIDDKNRLIGAEILDSTFTLSYKKIRVGEDLNTILKKLSSSKNLISIDKNKIFFLFRVYNLIKGCKECSVYISLEVESKTEKLSKISFEITDEVQF